MSATPSPTVTLGTICLFGFATIGLAGCPKTAPVAAVAPPPIEGLLCPPGTTPTGASPPHGVEAWCAIVTPGKSIRQGPAVIWHQNGQIKEQGSYAENYRDGEWSSFYADGTLQAQGTYVSGRMNGLWTHYDDYGDKVGEGERFDNVEHGKWTYWNTDAMTRSEGVWAHGERDGAWLDYDANDTPIRKKVYSSGRMLTTEEL